MDYEKKYKEVLEDIRVIYPNLKGDAKLAVEHAFPELKESEDERIRKELIDAFAAYDIESSWNGIPVSSVLLWLERQTEQKHDAIDAKSERVIKAARSVLNNWLDGTDCPDVSGDFAELEYAIRKYDGEEKQKEQKKEPVEHWQYVGRVNLEEDKEEQRPMADQPFEEWLDGWFKEHEEDGEIKMTAKEFKNWSRGIRNMYAEQKPVEIKIDNPNLQKIDPDVKISTSDSSAGGDRLLYASWRDEKAEQKPNIELIQKSWYMEGYHDCEFGYEPRWVIKTGEGGPRYEENPKYGQMLEAEQKPVEYLDKDKVYAIMKKLVKLAAFSQLIPINSEEYKMIDEITCDIHKLLDYPIEQKPAEWSEEDERILKGIIGKIDHDQTYGVSKVEMLSFLRFLRPQPHTVSVKDATKFGNLEYERGVKDGIQSEKSRQWKPSEEQMKALEVIVRYGDKESTHIKSLRDLYEQLKKLK